MCVRVQVYTCHITHVESEQLPRAGSSFHLVSALCAPGWLVHKLPADTPFSVSHLTVGVLGL